MASTRISNLASKIEFQYIKSISHFNRTNHANSIWPWSNQCHNLYELTFYYDISEIISNNKARLFFCFVVLNDKNNHMWVFSFIAVNFDWTKPEDIWDNFSSTHLWSYLFKHMREISELYLTFNCIHYHTQANVQEWYVIDVKPFIASEQGLAFQWKILHYIKSLVLVSISNYFLN